MSDLNVGTRVDHERYGEGIVSEVGMTSASIFFARGGKMQISVDSDELEVLEQPEGSGGASSGISLSQMEEVITHVMRKYNGLHEEIEMGDKWDGGNLILEPGNTDMQSKTIPIDTFFHKIVMVRDRLRVLEQSINSSSTLSEQEKVGMQQYISKAYGSLTTFNVLFANKGDQFSSK